MENSDFVSHLSQFSFILQIFGLQFFSVRSVVENLSKKQRIKMKVIYIFSFMVQLVAALLTAFRIYDILQVILLDMEKSNGSITITNFITLVGFPCNGLYLLIKMYYSSITFIKKKKFQTFYKKCLKIQTEFESKLNCEVSLKTLKNLFLIKSSIMMLKFIAIFLSVGMRSGKLISILSNIYIVGSSVIFCFNFKFLIEMNNEFLCTLRDFVRKSVDDLNLLQNNSLRIEENTSICSKNMYTLRYIYSLIRENTIIIEEMSQFTMLILVFISFIGGTSFGHGIFLGYIQEQIIHPRFFVQLSILTFTLFIVYECVKACQNTRKAEEELTFELQNLYAEHFISLSRGDRLLISQMIRNLHYDPIEYTVGGFYTMNLKFFAVVSHFLLYQQFFINVLYHFYLVFHRKLIKPIHLVAI